MARILEKIEDIEYIFCPRYFGEAVENYSKQHKCTKNSVYELIASKCGRSYDSVKDWTKVNKSGPSDKDLLMSVASILSVNYIDLLCVKTNYSSINMNEIKVNALTEKEVIREVYRLLLELGYYYADTNGLYIPERRDIVDPVIINDYQNGRINLIKDFINKAALDISGEVWTKLNIIVKEMEFDIMDNTPYRWSHFQYYNIAKLIIDMDINEVFDYLITEESYTELYCYVVGKMCNDSVINEENYDIYNREYDISPSELYKWVFTELLVYIFKSDFPEFFGNDTDDIS